MKCIISFLYNEYNIKKKLSELHSRNSDLNDSKLETSNEIMKIQYMTN